MQSFLKAAISVSIPVSRLKKSVAFYSDKLGFIELKRDDSIGWVELGQPDSGAHIGLAEVQDVVNGGPVLVFEVTDIDAAREAIIQKGVRVSPVTTVPDIARVATFEDPDSHALMLRQSL